MAPPIKPVDQAIDDLIAAARAEARAAALCVPSLVRVPDALHELRLSIDDHVDRRARLAEGRERVRDGRALLAALDQVLANPDTHTLTLASEANRAALRARLALELTTNLTRST